MKIFRLKEHSQLHSLDDGDGFKGCTATVRDIVLPDPMRSDELGYNVPIVVRDEDGSVILQLNVCVNFELEKSLLEFGDGVKVLQPKSLVRPIAARLRLAAGQYDKAESAAAIFFQRKGVYLR